MNGNQKENTPIKFIREICKDKSEKELIEAEEYFREFLIAIKEMSDRIEGRSEYLDFDE